MRTYKNILRHELTGLDCEIVGALNKSQIGIKGKIVEETLKTIVIKNDSLKRIQKKGTVFRLQTPKEKIDVYGDFIVSRPEDRIKKKIKKW
ncbi:MAG: ribonuclease P protein subunit [Candidatus Aenigmarchaeota archaeon]|nr:ribonuclease P protein subunit [Candidatus Aenigmarchaeota archaeon]